MQLTDLGTLVRGLDRKIGEQKSMLVHLERQNRTRHQPARPGQQVILRAAAALARIAARNDFLAEALEEKAAVAPAMTGVSTWASELAVAGLPSLILSLERQSAMAAILARSPQVSLLGVGAMNVPVAAAAPPAQTVAEGNAIPVLKGTFSPLSLTAFKVAAIMHFSKELAETTVIENAVHTMLNQSVSAGIDQIAFGTNCQAACSTACHRLRRRRQHRLKLP